MKLSNIYQAIPAGLQQELFEQIGGNGKVRIERILSAGCLSPDEGWYDQECDEWVILLKGEAELTFKEGEVVRLGEGDYLTIKAHCVHKVSFASQDALWLAMHY